MHSLSLFLSPWSQKPGWPLFSAKRLGIRGPMQASHEGSELYPPSQALNGDHCTDSGLTGRRGPAHAVEWTCPLRSCTVSLQDSVWRPWHGSAEYTSTMDPQGFTASFSALLTAKRSRWAPKSKLWSPLYLVARMNSPIVGRVAQHPRPRPRA
jgi:hypothetical protein